MLLFVGRDLGLVLGHGTKRSFRSGHGVSFGNGSFVGVRLYLLISIFVLASLGWMTIAIEVELMSIWGYVWIKLVQIYDDLIIFDIRQG